MRRASDFIRNKTITFIDFSLGDFVTHPEKPEWGIGQVQSVIDAKVTVNFLEVGKLVIDVTLIELVAAIQNEQR